MNEMIIKKLKQWAAARRAAQLPPYSAPEIAERLILYLLLEVAPDAELEEYKHSLDRADEVAHKSVSKFLRDIANNKE